MNPLNHVAIIMDGNGRWGLKNNKTRNAGHRTGLDVVQNTIKFCLKKKIKCLTLYAFSTENWKRPKREIQFLFQLLENFLENKIKILEKNKIKLKIIGDKKAFSRKIKYLLKKTESKTSKNNIMQINLALNYGSKNELINAVKKMIKKKSKINEENFNNNLYTTNIPDPELLIRTGNTRRLSNFLLWQMAYTEIFFEKKLWPDFTESDFKKVLSNFKKLKRNFGNI